MQRARRAKSKQYRDVTMHTGEQYRDAAAHTEGKGIGMDILQECRGAKVIGISAHVRPDGDAIGSGMALYLFW